MVRSSCGRFSCIRFIRSRNLVRVRAVVAICWRKLAMMDYTRGERGSGGVQNGTLASIIYSADHSWLASRDAVLAAKPIRPAAQPTGGRVASRAGILKLRQ